MAKMYAIGLDADGNPVSFGSDDSEGFDLAALTQRLGADLVVEVAKQPGVGEKYDAATKAIVKK